jgi:hypothetical protein
MGKLKLLLMNGLIPLVVFDGAKLPMKKRTEEERKK